MKKYEGVHPDAGISMSAITFIGPWHRGHSSGSASKTRLTSLAQFFRTSAGARSASAVEPSSAPEPGVPSGPGGEASTSFALRVPRVLFE